MLKFYRMTKVDSKRTWMLAHLLNVEDLTWSIG